MNNFAEPVSSFFAAYASSVLARDADALCSLYAEDIVVFDAWDTWSCMGIDAWRAAIDGWFSSLDSSERVRVEHREMTSQVTQEMAFGHAILTYSAVSADGRQLRALENRMTVVLRNIQGRWKVVHEHTSCPADFRSKAVLLRRQQ